MKFMPPLHPDLVNKLQFELNELDRELVRIDGHNMKPSQCYRFSADPMHVLFNTNCPDSLKERVNAIIAKYSPQDESRA
jgi:hypothetical protein